MTILPKKKPEKEESERDGAELPHGLRLPAGPEPTRTPRAWSAAPATASGGTAPPPTGPPARATGPAATTTGGEEEVVVEGGGGGGGVGGGPVGPGAVGQRASASPRSEERGPGVVGGGGGDRGGGGGGGGCNSEDEHEAGAGPIQQQQQQQQPQQDAPSGEQGEAWFENVLKENQGFIIKRMSEDGACLFRAVADQVYGDQDMHDVVRKHCMDYLMKNADYFSNYVTEDFTTYVNRKRMNHCHGNHIEMQAMAEMYNRTFEVYQYSTEPINTFHSIYRTDNEPIRVSYHQNAHYNSVVNPNKATIGVGLGLPSFKPGNADKTLMQSAIKTSEESWIEQQMLEDKKRATDWEATNEAIEEQVARESYLQWLREHEKQATQPRKATATCSSATAAAAGVGGGGPAEESGGRSPRPRVALCSSPDPPEATGSEPGPRGGPSSAGPKPPSPGPSIYSKPPSPTAGTSSHVYSPQPSSSQAFTGLHGAASQPLDSRTVMQQMSPTAFGLTDWEDDDILASVMAASQQEYLDSLRKHAGGPPQSPGSVRAPPSPDSS
ncbi:unnamed protein product [Lampetra planeri]